jgi:hypothetical protein
MERCIYFLWIFVNVLITFIVKHIEIVWGQIQTQCLFHMLL